jgi:hypothetical protein
MSAAPESHLPDAITFFNKLSTNGNYILPVPVLRPDRIRLFINPYLSKGRAKCLPKGL